MQRHQERQDGELRKAQEQRLPKEVEARMRQNLQQRKEPHLTPKGQGNQLKNARELEQAITDYAGGRQARVDAQYRVQVDKAHTAANRTVTREHALEKEKLREAHQRERDAFLDKAERARGRSAKDAFNDKARPKDRPAQVFDKAARDPSFRRAFDRAAQKEREQERERGGPVKEQARSGNKPKDGLSKEFDKASDPSLQRAFNRAARDDPNNRDGPNHDPRDSPRPR